MNQNTYTEGAQYKVLNWSHPLTPQQLKQILNRVSDNPKRDGIHERRVEVNVNLNAPLVPQVLGDGTHRGLFSNLGSRQYDPYTLFVLPRITEVAVLVLHHLIQVRQYPVRVVRLAKDHKVLKHVVIEILEMEALHDRAMV